MKDEGGGFEVVLTRGGARAMRDRETGEVMHPVVGPLVEAPRLYVTPARLSERLQSPAADPLVVLDVGLGAGSNAVAAWQVSARAPDAARRLELVSFDRTLAALELALAGENVEAFGFDPAARQAARALSAEGCHESARSTWRLRIGDLLPCLAMERDASADVVFWDPFSPRSNPELWTTAAFRALRRVCREGATVHTYSAATSVRTALLLADFAVGFGVAAGEKQKQTTVAAMDFRDLSEPLDRRWLERLARSSAPLPSDAPAGALETIARAPQFNGE